MDLINEKNYYEMSSSCHEYPAQIPIRKSRLNYLLKEYSPRESDRWVMFAHANHFLIYESITKFCIFDAEYIDLKTAQEESDPVCAVINKIKTNQDPIQHPKDIEDDFNVVADLIKKEL